MQASCQNNTLAYIYYKYVTTYFRIILQGENFSFFYYSLHLQKQLMLIHETKYQKYYDAVADGYYHIIEIACVLL